MNKITYAKISGYDAAIAAAVTADVHVIARSGILDETDLTSLCDELVSLVCSGRSNLVLDLSGVSHVPYGGFRSLASCARFSQQSGGGLKLSGLSIYLFNLVRAEGLYNAFEYFEDERTAVADFAAEAGPGLS
ncbi:STAS domain-containing protein [Vulgatibacter incomptus]|uniref:Putative anti-sigma factor antagonist n=1 Tax=Vulgatibacter incomptus TaxID=1391653 RepID=A0A0K1PEE5_9BACT|nr:STAS domain-containing protein [Vulgatibacter incomptus]AKU91872.1 putative anti-sigma factor antagonist [Vulgatibacter incomptus]